MKKFFQKLRFLYQTFTFNFKNKKVPFEKTIEPPQTKKITPKEVIEETITLLNKIKVLREQGHTHHANKTEQETGNNCAIILSNINGQQKSYLIPNIIFPLEDPTKYELKHLKSIEKTEQYLHENGFSSVALKSEKSTHPGFYQPILSYLEPQKNKDIFQFPPQFFNLN
jgi:hypothetical protein